MADFLEKLRKENKKYKSHITPISMDWKRSCHTLLLCKKPYEKDILEEK